MKMIIESKRSVVVAADVSNLVELEFLVKNMMGIAGIGGFKLGITMGLQGLYSATSLVRGYLGVDFPVIYDHQKAGNDIPDMGQPFAKTLKEAGVSAAILFPFAGPETEEGWLRACRDEGLEVIVGGVMTHPKFLVSEGGYIADEAVERIYRLACQWDVSNFVVPGTKLDWVKRVRGWLVEERGEGEFSLWAPGFLTQGGDISECGQAAGDNWHAIVGSGIYKKSTSVDQRTAALAVTSQIAT
jgi:orotidine-5'-phosphate decarboxylase